MEQIEQMKQQGYQYIGHGFLHNVYEKDGLIYKCLKNECMNSFHKFEHEKACMDFLREKGIPTVQVVDIMSDEILPDVCFLVEEKANGINYSKENMPGTLRDSFFAYLMKITEIEMSFWGDTKPDGTEKEKDWFLFLTSYIKGLDGLPADIKNGYSENKLFAWMTKKLSKDIKPHFLVMDSNPENFFWNEKNEICSVIDIDHPVCGDPLFQMASIIHEWGDLACDYINKNISEAEKEIVSFYGVLIRFNDILLSRRLNVFNLLNR